MELCRPTSARFASLYQIIHPNTNTAQFLLRFSICVNEIRLEILAVKIKSCYDEKWKWQSWSSKMWGFLKAGLKSKSQIRHKIIYSYCVLLFNIFYRRQVFQKMSLKVQRTFSRIESRGLCVGSAQNEITDFAKKTDNFCRNIDYNFRILRPQFLKG